MTVQDWPLALLLLYSLWQLARFLPFLTQNKDDCLRYYQQNQEKFKTLPLIEVSHILLAADPKDIGMGIKQKQTADKLITQLQENPCLFNISVTGYSDCPSKKMGGSLGQLSKGQTVAEFEHQIFPLLEGLHDKPLESRYGYHIAWINKKLMTSYWSIQWWRSKSITT